MLSCRPAFPHGRYNAAEEVGVGIAVLPELSKSHKGKQVSYIPEMCAHNKGGRVMGTGPTAELAAAQ